MVEVIWTNYALADLESIASYISKDSEKYAEVTVKKLFYRTDILKSFPYSGRMVPEKGIKTIRELIEGNYRIIYEIIEEKIYVLSVHHSARLIK
jgi:toxin ParE1/3/4